MGRSKMKFKVRTVTFFFDKKFDIIEHMDVVRHGWFPNYKSALATAKKVHKPAHRKETKHTLVATQIVRGDEVIWDSSDKYMH